MITYSFKILRFNFFVNAFIPYITTPANITRFGLMTAQVTALTTFLTDWNLKFTAYVSPITNGRITIDAINASYQSGYTLTQGIRTIIKNISTITLTSEERIVCNLKRPDLTHTPAGIPKSSPAVTCILQTAMNMLLTAVDSKNSFKKAKPPGVDAIGIKTAIIGLGSLPPAPGDYVRQEDETTSEFEMLFTAGQAGKVLYLIAFYINSRGEAGPDSIPYIITII